MLFLRRHIINNESQYKWELDSLFGDNINKYISEVEKILEGLSSMTPSSVDKTWFSFSDTEEEILFLMRNTFYLYEYTYPNDYNGE